jgi:DNA adenine methylase
MKSLKTPLRYPGGKSRACVKMNPYFPDLRDYDEFREPFIGGGSVAIHITKKYPNLDIWVNDLYEPLVNFWQQLQMFGVDLKDKLVDFKSEYNTPDKQENYSANQRFVSMNHFYQILIVLQHFIL